MTFSLGRAEFIIDANAQPLIAAQAVAYKQVRVEADKVTKDLAQQNRVREDDVRKSASILIDAEKKLAKEQLAEQKRLDAERRKQIRDSIKNDVAELKNSEKQRKEIARSIADAEKQIERDRLETVRRTLREEATLRRQHEQQRREEARKLAQEEANQAKSGVLGSGVSTARVGGTVATLLGFGAIASGALVARESILGLVEATTKQDQAQRALNAAFKESLPVYKEIAEATSKQFSLINNEVTTSIAQFGTLGRQSNLSSEQLKALIPVALDLQAAYGGDLREAFRSVQGAILGETEALEKYGIVLQDGVLKTLPQLTEEEKKRFETMSESEKQLIRYRVLMDLASDSTGSAAQRAKEAQGGFNDFSNALDNLAKRLGQDTVPFLGNLARVLSTVIDRYKAALDTAREIGLALQDLREKGNFLPGAETVEDQISINRRREQIQKDADNLAAQRKQAIQDAQKAENARIDAENAAIKRRAELEVNALKDSAERRIRDIDNQKRQAEAQLRIALDSIEKQKDAELERLRVTEEARRNASAAEARRIEAEKDAAIQAVEDRKDAVLQALEVEKDAVIAAAEEQIRQAEITRDKIIRSLEERRDAAIKDLEAEKRQRDNLRIQEDRQIEDSIEQESRRREAAHKQRLRQFDLEADALEEQYDKDIKAIEKKERLEDDRHAKRVKQLEQERDTTEDIYDSQIKAIEEQIRALDALKNAEDNRRKIRDLEARRSEAQQTLVRVQGTGTPEQIVQARTALTAAIRTGDPEYIKKRQAELVEVAGRGIEEIEKARKDLAEVEQDLSDESVDQARDAERDKLEAAKRALQEQKDTHKKTIDAELDKERSAEDERAKRRKRALDDDKQAAKDRLDDAKKKIEEREREERDAYDKDKQGAEDAAETAKRVLEDRRRAENEKYKDDLDRIKDTSDKEIEATKRTYNDEEVGLIPNIRRAVDYAKTQYQSKVQAAQQAYEAERKEIYNTYDHPETGLISRHRQAEEAARQNYQNATIAATNHFNTVKEQVQQTYRNNDGQSGIIDRLDELKRQTQEQLRLDLAEWEKWKDGLVGPNGVITKTWDQAKKDFDAFLQDIKNRGGATIRPRIVVDVSIPNSAIPPSNSAGPDPGTSGGTNPGIPGVDPNLSVGGNGGGGGGSSAPPSGSGGVPTGPAPEEESSGQVDVNFARFIPRLGFAEKYNGTHKARPGWEVDGDTAAWPYGPTRHKGIDLLLPGGNNGYGQPIGAFTSGTVSSIHQYSGNPYTDPQGNRVTITDKSGKTHWYLHLQKWAVSVNQPVKRGDLIGYLGDTGTEDIQYPHLHYEVRDGMNDGALTLKELGTKSLDPMPYIRGRDKGYMFNNPTMYRDTVTGEVGVLAERGPEMLLGRQETRSLSNVMKGQNTGGPALNRVLDYAAIGSNVLDTPSVISTTNGGDTMNYYGVAPEDVLQKWRDDQRRQRVLRGRTRG